MCRDSSVKSERVVCAALQQRFDVDLVGHSATSQM